MDLCEAGGTSEWLEWAVFRVRRSEWQKNIQESGKENG